MRTIKTARKELRFLQQILQEFEIDYEQAQSEEDLTNRLHQEFLQKISEVYWKCKDLELRLRGIN